jgi:hypothetical protein
MWMGFQLFGVQNKWDHVWSNSKFLDFEAYPSSVVFWCVYVFLLCKEFVEVFFVGTWILMFCRFGCGVPIRVFSSSLLWVCCEYGDNHNCKCQPWSTQHKKCIAILAYNFIVYLHQRLPLVHDTILICKYCINLFLNHPRLLEPQMVHQMQYQ